MITSSLASAAVLYSTTASKTGLAMANAGAALGKVAFLPLMAAGGDLTNIFKPIMLVVAVLLFMGGVVIAGLGFSNLKQGENGWLQIIGGIGMAVAGPIMAYFFRNAGYADAIIQPGEN